MILAILVVAVLFDLFVLQRYIVCKEHSRTHRLLPLMLGIIGITDLISWRNCYCFRRFIC